MRVLAPGYRPCCSHPHHLARQLRQLVTKFPAEYELVRFALAVLQAQVEPIADSYTFGLCCDQPSAQDVRSGPSN